MSDEKDQLWASFFDLNEPRLPFRFLGTEVGACVQDASEVMQNDPDSRRAAIAALQATRLALPKLASLAGASSEAAQAFEAICASLRRVEAALREVEAGAQPSGVLAPPSSQGRPRAIPDDLAFQGRAVLAVKWLQRLTARPLSRTEGLAAVARVIPKSMVSRRDHHTLTPKEQLDAWIDAFGRKDDATRRRVLSDLRYDIWAAWFRCWRELQNANGAPALTHKGAPVYGDWIERDQSDATPDDVIAWLKQESHF